MSYDQYEIKQDYKAAIKASQRKTILKWIDDCSSVISALKIINTGQHGSLNNKLAEGFIDEANQCLRDAENALYRLGTK